MAEYYDNFLQNPLRVSSFGLLKLIVEKFILLVEHAFNLILEISNLGISVKKALLIDLVGQLIDYLAFFFNYLTLLCVKPTARLAPGVDDTKTRQDNVPVTALAELGCNWGLLDAHEKLVSGLESLY